MNKPLTIFKFIAISPVGLLFTTRLSSTIMLQRKKNPKNTNTDITALYQEPIELF